MQGASGEGKAVIITQEMIEQCSRELAERYAATVDALWKLVNDDQECGPNEKANVERWVQLAGESQLRQNGENMQENLIRRTCDYCGEKVLLKQNEEPAERWLITVREEFKDGNPAPTVKHYCKDSCAVNALRLEGRKVGDVVFVSHTENLAGDQL